MATATTKKKTTKKKAAALPPVPKKAPKKATTTKKKTTKKATATTPAEPTPPESTTPATGIDFSPTGNKTANARFDPAVPLGKIRVMKGFNPRLDTGDLSGLQSLIKKDGLMHPLTVRPSEKSGHFDLVAGERRYRALMALADRNPSKWSAVMAIIRLDLDDDGKAFAVACSENSEDGRTNLTMVELGKAAQRLAKEHNWKPQQIATELRLNHMKIRRAMRIVEGPADIVDRCQRGDISAGVAHELSQMDSSVYDKIKDDVDGASEAEVKRMAKRAAQESGAEVPTDGARNNRRKGASRSAAAVTWVGPSVMSKELRRLAYDLFLNKDDEDEHDTVFYGTMHSVTTLLWCRGDWDTTYPPEAPFEDEWDSPKDFRKAQALFEGEMECFWALVKVEHDRCVELGEHSVEGDSEGEDEA